MSLATPALLADLPVDWGKDVVNGKTSGFGMCVEMGFIEQLLINRLFQYG